MLLTAVDSQGRVVLAAQAFRTDEVQTTELLVACDTCVAGYAVGGDGNVKLEWQHPPPIRSSRVLHAAPLGKGAFLMIIAHAHGDGQPAYTALVTQNGGGWQRSADSHRPQVTASAHLVPLDDVEHHSKPRAWRPVFSNLARWGPSSRGSGSDGGGVLLAASLEEGRVHLVQAHSTAGGDWELHCAASNLCDLITTDPGACIMVECLALGAASQHLPAHSGRLNCSILYSSHRLGACVCVKHAACLEVEAPHTLLPSCCWFLGNLHPSTTLVAALPGSHTLVASSSRLLLLRSDAPQKRREVRVSLAGTPTCATALSQELVVVADSTGHLLLLDLQHLRVAPVAQGLLPAASSCLAFLPTPAPPLPASQPGAAEAAGATADAAAPDAAPPAGILFVGSSSGGSVFLELSRPVLYSRRSSRRMDDWWHHLAAPCAWQVVSADDALQLSASLAPVASCQLIADPSGCGDKCLLMCRGVAPFGSLAVGRLAAGLNLLAVGGGELPGPVRLLGLRASPFAACHRYLLLSSEAGAGGQGWTTVLEVTASGLSAAQLPGLQLEAATLVAFPLAAGLMVQVTPQAARTFRPSTGDVHSTWQPHSGALICQAAVREPHLAVAYSTEVQVLLCSGGSGLLQEERRLQLHHQASALTLFRLGSHQEGSHAGVRVQGDGGEVWVAVGLWSINEVLLQPLLAGQPATRLSLGPCQPRSLAVCQLGSTSAGSSVGHGYSGTSSPHGGAIPSTDTGSQRGSGGGSCAPHLVVGTSTGELLWWRLSVQLDDFGSGSGAQLEGRGRAQAGLGPVTLHPLPHPQAGVLAVSDQTLLLSADPHSSNPVARLHGGQGWTAACPLDTPGLPGGCLAYIQGGQLHVASLDPAVRLRWDELVIAGGAPPSLAAYHAASGCAALACNWPSGCSLHVVDVAAMQELAQVPLPTGHSVTALAVVPLPCSSLGMQHTHGSARGGSVDQKAPAAAAPRDQLQLQCTQFLLVALAPRTDTPAPQHGSAGSSSSRPATEDELPLPADGDASQPWWRQQGAAGNSSNREQQHDGAPSQHAGLLCVYQVRHSSGADATAAHASSSSSGEQASCGAKACNGIVAVSSISAAYELVLHGCCVLPVAAFSLAAVQPAVQPFYAPPPSGAAGDVAASGSSSSPTVAAAAAAAHPHHPLLAAGCEDGVVRLYRMFVDDAGVEGQAAVEAALEAITHWVPHLHLAHQGQENKAAAEQAGAAPQPHTSHAATSSSAEEGGAAAPNSRRLWHGHVAMQLVAKAPTCSEGVVGSLAVQGSTVYALDLLSSLTAFRVQPVAGGQLPSLIPLSCDLSGRHISAMLPLDNTLVLAGQQSNGLLMVQRDREAERHRHMAVRQRWERQTEQGDPGAGGGGVSGGGGPLPPTLLDAAALDVVASQHGPSGFAGMGTGLLGVPLQRIEQVVVQDSRGKQAHIGSSGSGSSTLVATATLVCNNGTVLSVFLLTPAQHEVLFQLQQAAEAAADLVHSSGGCVDCSLLKAAYSSPGQICQLAEFSSEATVLEGLEILKCLSLV